MERYCIAPECAVYFLTYSIIDWLPIFIAESPCKIITDSLTHCYHEKHLRINAYVVMPTHMHLIVFAADSNTERLIHTLADFRKFTGRRICDACLKHAPACCHAAMRDAATVDRERRCWQPSRHPEAIETERFWQQKLDYLHDNPRRKGLVAHPAHWRFSSATWYLSDGSEPNEVPLTAISW